MERHEVLDSQQSMRASRVERAAGSWCLAPRRAMALWPRRDGWLEIAHGGVWLTVSGPGAPSGDLFLRAGDACRLGPGQCAVLEAWRQGPAEPGTDAVAFRWRETQSEVGSDVAQAGAGVRRSWSRDVAPSWQALSVALRAAARAQAAVVRASFGAAIALGTWGVAVFAGRPRTGSRQPCNGVLHRH